MIVQGKFDDSPVANSFLNNKGLSSAVCRTIRTSSGGIVSFVKVQVPAGRLRRQMKKRITDHSTKQFRFTSRRSDSVGSFSLTTLSSRVTVRCTSLIPKMESSTFDCSTSWRRREKQARSSRWIAHSATDGKRAALESEDFSGSKPTKEVKISGSGIFGGLSATG